MMYLQISILQPAELVPIIYRAPEKFAMGTGDRGPSLDIATRSKALLHWYMAAHAMIATSSEISSLQRSG